MDESTEKFIEKAKAVHGDRYDYSGSEYVRSNQKLMIVCPEHGPFYQTPNNHVAGKNHCPQCATIIRSRANTSNIGKFIEKARAIHGGRYDYSKSRYTNQREKVIIICAEHGDFKQAPHDHLAGRGCPKCARRQQSSINGEQFIKRAKKIHKNKYDYSKVNYKNNRVKVIIICPEHGDFKQSPSGHLCGYGCAECGHLSSAKSSISSTSVFIRKASKLHVGRYDYSKVDYINNRTAVIIICPEHGEFIQTPQIHLNGHGCQKCAKIASSESIKLNTDDFVEKACIQHGDRYDYSKVNYVSSETKVLIGCPDHGYFEQTPHHHLGGHGCAACPTIISKPHQEIADYIRTLYDGEILINDRSVICPSELDIYIPARNVAIEMHGIYHHSFNKQESRHEKMRHSRKHDKCRKANIRLMQIWDSEWINQKGIIKSKIGVMLGIGSRIHARKCNIYHINNKDYKEFINKYHLQGYRPSSVRMGLTYHGQLVEIMSFNKHPKHCWEIIRLASSGDHVIVGGTSKLLSNFEHSHNPAQILTFADRRYSHGDVYKKLGFELQAITSPNYFYTADSRNLLSRQKFQKHKLKEKLGNFDPSLTEAQNMFNNGYRRIWDAGHYKFLKRSQLE